MYNVTNENENPIFIQLKCEDFIKNPFLKNN